MKTHLAAVLFIVAALWAPERTFAQRRYIGILTGGQEVPPVESSALSLAYFQFTPNNTALIGLRFNFNHDQTVTMVHIHDGAAGVDGPIILDLRPGGFCIDLAGGALTYYIAFPGQLREGLTSMDELNTRMNSGNTYLNLHTPENPGGWIRGQMIPLASSQRETSLRLTDRLREVGAQLEKTARGFCNFWTGMVRETLRLSRMFRHPPATVEHGAR